MIQGLKNSKIATKLKLMFICIAILYATTIQVSLSSVSKIASELDNFYNQPYTVTKAILTLKSSFISVQKYIYQAVTTRDLTQINDTINKINTEHSLFDENWNTVKSNLTDSNLTTELDQLISNSFSTCDKILNEAKTNSASAFQMFENEYMPIAQKEEQYVNDIIDTLKIKADEYKSEGNKQKVQSIITLSSIEFITLIFIIFSYFLFKKFITNPIFEIEKAAKDMLNGNLNTSISYKSNDELGHLAHSIRNTIKTLKEYITDIDNALHKIAEKDTTTSIDIEYIGDFHSIKNSITTITDVFNNAIVNMKETAKQVNNGAAQVSQAGQTIAQGATDQSNAVQSLLISINEITENVNDNAQKARNVTEISSNSTKEIVEGNTYMQNLLNSMKKISNQSEEISKITKLVDDISSQTNLLSLNASIEAARAGEHGKGFAVVANEIGNLASESANATRNIASLIEETLKVVQDGSSLADETAIVLENVVKSSENTSSLVQDISNACDNQAKSLNEVLNGLQQISNITESNSAVAQQTSAASEELLSQAEIVTNLLSEFKTK